MHRTKSIGAITASKSKKKDQTLFGYCFGPNRNDSVFVSNLSADLGADIRTYSSFNV